MDAGTTPALLECHVWVFFGGTSSAFRSEAPHFISPSYNSTHVELFGNWIEALEVRCGAVVAPLRYIHFPSLTVSSGPEDPKLGQAAHVKMLFDGCGRTNGGFTHKTSTRRASQKDVTSTQYTVHSTQYTVHSTQYTVHSTQYTVHSTLCTHEGAARNVHSAHYILPSTHCTVHCGRCHAMHHVVRERFSSLHCAEKEEGMAVQASTWFFNNKVFFAPLRCWDRSARSGLCGGARWASGAGRRRSPSLFLSVSCLYHSFSFCPLALFRTLGSHSPPPPSPRPLALTSRVSWHRLCCCAVRGLRSFAAF
jgi:hypothetical protein